ncbi:hypothetical protein B0H11DRAFT_1924615 [Mycena galericulata]|nr:hypothetical protein B0H11DRAFT_1924615 [Mycena galericulata]
MFPGQECTPKWSLETSAKDGKSKAQQPLKIFLNQNPQAHSRYCFKTAREPLGFKYDQMRSRRRTPIKGIAHKFVDPALAANCSEGRGDLGGGLRGGGDDAAALYSHSSLYALDQDANVEVFYVWTVRMYQKFQFKLVSSTWNVIYTPAAVSAGIQSELVPACIYSVFFWTAFWIEVLVQNGPFWFREIPKNPPKSYLNT